MSAAALRCACVTSLCATRTARLLLALPRPKSAYRVETSCWVGCALKASILLAPRCPFELTPMVAGPYLRAPTIDRLRQRRRLDLLSPRGLIHLPLKAFCEGSLRILQLSWRE